ncbi:MAG TPA: DUF4177 domain-containing protein [Anaerolineales bacterium]|nr:DUF4177 domain-containing protein [Anaerolineales bacterium]
METLAKWEYRVVSFGGILSDAKNETIEDALNALGEEGWEVVSAVAMDNSNRVRLIAKRPLTRASRRERSMPY